MMFLHPTRRQIARSFSLKASRYSKHAQVQDDVLNRLFDMLGAEREGLAALRNARIVDLGSGVSNFARQYTVRARPMVPKLLCIDLAAEALQAIRTECGHRINGLVADIEELPVRPGSFDVAVLSSVIQWLSNPAKALRAANNCLGEGGLLAYSAFLPPTHAELKALGLFERIPCPVSYYTAEELSTFLENAGFSLISLNELVTTSHFATPWDALRSFSRIGASVHAGVRLTRRELSQLCADYGKRFGGEQGVPLTYAVAYGIARKAAKR